MQMELPAKSRGVSMLIIFLYSEVRFRHHAGSLLAILIKVLCEAERKNWNCLSPAQRDEFSNFSAANLALSKMGKPANAGC